MANESVKPPGNGEDIAILPGKEVVNEENPPGKEVAKEEVNPSGKLLATAKPLGKEELRLITASGRLTALTSIPVGRLLDIAIALGSAESTVIADGKLAVLMSIAVGRLLDSTTALGNEELTTIAVGKLYDPILIAVGRALDIAKSALTSAIASNTVVSESRSVGNREFKFAILLCKSCTDANKITA